MNWPGKKSNTSSDEISLDSEIAFHVEELTQANIAAGMNSVEARRRALLDFGGHEQVKQQIREVHLSAVLEGSRSNLRSALRFIRRSPSFAVVVALTLGLGIGANSAVFSAIDAILLRPLSFPHGDELVQLEQQNLKKKGPQGFAAPARLEDWNRDNSTFQAISGYYTQSISVRTGDLPEKVTEAFVSPRFLKVWGVEPLLGRDFTSAEQKFGGPGAVLVSERFWRTHLQGDPKAVGRPLGKGDPLTVVGVLPATFRFPDRDTDLWMCIPGDSPYTGDRDSTWYKVTGRLKPGVSLAQAQADLATVQARLAKQYPKTDGDLTVALQPLKTIVTGAIWSSLWVLYGSVSLLLLIACTNIAALLLARTAEREHEVAIRYSLGASRRAIVLQLLTEVFVLAVMGSLAGLLIAAGSSRVFSLLSKDLPRADEIALNWRVVLYSLACTVVVTVVCGLFPAIRGSHAGVSGQLAHASRTQVSGRNPWQSILIGVQISLAVALLIGAGLLLRSFEAIRRVAPGFSTDRVLTMRISGGYEETAEMDKLKQRIIRTLNGLRSVPGVEAVATSSAIPGNSAQYPMELKVSEGKIGAGEKITADVRFVSAEYFPLLAIPMLEGEGCRDGLRNDAVIVNRSFAERYFGSSPAIGYHLQSAVENSFMQAATIKGVVGDAREQGLEKAPEPTVYWCNNAPNPDPHYLIRTEGDPMALSLTLRRKVHELEPGRSMFDVMPLDDHLEDRQGENRLRTILLTLFALTAIALVSIGLYGTISYLGRQRRREVGLRLALGALPGQIIGKFLVQGLRITLAGCVAGLLLALGVSRLLMGMLYGISMFDPLTYAGVLLLTFIVAAAASLIPSVRAARVEPTEVLREG
jgi:putative ABC transport system permease protein